MKTPEDNWFFYDDEQAKKAEKVISICKVGLSFCWQLEPKQTFLNIEAVAILFHLDHKQVMMWCIFFLALVILCTSFTTQIFHVKPTKFAVSTYPFMNTN